MNKFEIDYEYGIADWWTTSAPELVLREFNVAANCCFGLRKSLGDTRIRASFENVAPPLPYREGDTLALSHGATHLLTHSGDEILFDFAHATADGDPWKLRDQGDWCSCKVRGQAELACSVHHFWVPDHNKVCSEHVR